MQLLIPTRRRPNQATRLLERRGARRLEPHRELRGHDFFPPRRELAQLPDLTTAFRCRPDRRVLYVHYFTAYCDWYVAGFEPSTGMAYGYTEDPRIDLHDWGWFDLNAMCRTLIACQPPVIVQRNLAWQPRSARVVIAPEWLAG